MTVWFKKWFQFKWLWVALGMGILLMASWISVMEWVNHKLKSRQTEIQTLLKEQIGSPLDLSSIQTGWSGLSLSVTLNDLIIYDRKTKVPFLTADKLTLRGTLAQFLLQSKNPFREIKVDGLKLRLRWTEHNDIVPLGLKGETLSATSSDSNYKSLLQGLASQERVTFKQSEIYWQGPHTRLLQKFDGVFSWQEVQSLSWRWLGKQEFKVNEGDFLPVTAIDLTMETAANRLTLQMEMAGIQVNAALTSLESTPRLDCELDIRSTALEPFHQNLILKPQDPQWIRWLVNALEKGTLTRGQIKISGPVDQLDWNGEIDYKHLDLQYSEQWPKIKQAKGQVLLSKDKVQVKVSKGKLSGASLNLTQAVISPLVGKESPEVAVEGSLEGTLENGLEFLQSSPLKVSVGDQLANVNPKGPMELQIKLNIPLDQKPSQVQGQVKVRNAELSMDQIESPVTDLTGTFDFTEKGVTGEGVKGKWMDQPVLFEVKPSHIKTKLGMSIDYLKSQLDTDYLNYLKGETEVTIQYHMEKEEWSFESNLKGIEIDLPPPLTKSKDSEKEMLLTLQAPSKSKEKEEGYSLSLKGELDAKWIMEKRGEDLQFKRGHLVLGTGKADWISQNVLQVGGELPHLDIDIWREFLGTLETAPQSLPTQLHVLAKDIEGFGLNFKNTWISLNYTKDKSEWKLDGPTIKGSIILPSKNQKTMQLYFDHLKLSLKEIKEQKDNEFFKGNERFPIQFFSKHVQLDDTVYGEVGFDLEPKPYGYEIKSLHIRTPDSLLEANGLWRLETLKEGELSFLQGVLTTDNISNTFTQWGFSTSMREGKGRIHFNLNWPGSPFQLKLNAAQGGARLKLRNGRILGVDPGLGKILGLLSFESLTRQLQLGFRDVLQKGFTFDTLEAAAVFKDGYARTDNLNLDGSAANIRMTGNANLDTKALDFQMRVVPKMGSTLPLAASLATGNPAVGVGVWFIDKLTGSKISSQGTKRYYHVTGTWDAPSMQEVRAPNRSLSRRK